MIVTITVDIKTVYQQICVSFTCFLQIYNTRLPPNSLVNNQSYLAKETQFAVAAVASKIVNNPPLFTYTSIEIDEDSGTSILKLNIIKVTFYMNNLHNHQYLYRTAGIFI